MTAGKTGSDTIMMTSPSIGTARGRIVVLNTDLMFGLRIQNTAKTLGFTAERVPSTAAFVERVAGDPTPVLAIVDLGASPDWAAMAELIAADIVPVLAFGPHMDVDALRAAKRAGVTRVVSNGDFHRGMPTLIERYAKV